MPSSRKPGTHPFVRSYGTGKTYSSLATWDDETDYNLATGLTRTISSSSGAVRSSNIVTITTTASHGFSVGMSVVISGVDDSSFNGQFRIASVPSSTTFTYAQSGSNATSQNGSAKVGEVTEVLEVYGSGYNDYVTVDGATTSASYFRIIRPASENFLGRASGGITSHHFDSTNNTSVFTLAESYSQIQDIVASLNINVAANYNCFNLTAGVTAAGFIGCVAIDCNNSASGRNVHGFYLYPTGTCTYYVVNCIAHNCDGSGYYVYSSADARKIYLYNCTSVGNALYGFDDVGLNNTTRIILKNCGATGNGSGQVRPPCTNTCSGSAPTFASGTDNFHLDSSDTVWLGQGTDLSSDAVYPFDDDLDGETRSGTWDIGADEYVLTTVKGPFPLFRPQT